VIDDDACILRTACVFCNPGGPEQIQFTK